MSGRRGLAVPLITHDSSPITALIMARDRLDGVDDLLVRDLVGGADEGRIAAVQQEDPVAVGVAAQGGHELAAFGLVQRAEVHSLPSIPSGDLAVQPLGPTGRALVRQSRPAASARSRYTPWSGAVPAGRS